MSDLVQVTPRDNMEHYLSSGLHRRFDELVNKNDVPIGTLITTWTEPNGSLNEDINPTSVSTVFIPRHEICLPQTHLPSGVK